MVRLATKLEIKFDQAIEDFSQKADRAEVYTKHLDEMDLDGLRENSMLISGWSQKSVGLMNAYVHETGREVPEEYHEVSGRILDAWQVVGEKYVRELNSMETKIK